MMGRGMVSRIAVGVLALVVGGQVRGQQEITSAFVDAEQRERPILGITASDATAWGLTEEDLTRYRSVMRGPEKLWYRTLDPVWVLGITAKTHAERLRYARLARDREQRRVHRELAFQRAYDLAWKEQGVAPIDLTKLAQRQQPAIQTALRSPLPSRQALFVDIACHTCAQPVRRMLQATQSGGWDVYVTGAEDDDAIRRWARDVGIEPERVRSRAVTLNHDHGRYFRLTGKHIDGVHVYRARTHEQRRPGW
jgi:integrating conjugative element protein (TIGR03759 family)